MKFKFNHNTIQLKVIKYINMGILRLNSYLKEHCSDCITTQPMSVLKNKRIVIDVQIYMYQFMCETNTSLIENMYFMCSLLVRHEIIPLFVFDNRKQIKNQNVLNKDRKKQERKQIRNKAIDSVVQMITNHNENNGESDNVLNTITEINWQKLKREIVSIKNSQITQIKRLIQTFGFTYTDAEEEADEVCAHVAITKNAYGCLSDDTDMFAYGCQNIFRNFNMTKQTVSFVNVPLILKKLKITKEELKEVCVLASNDYNGNIQNIMDIFSIMEQFVLYKNKKNNNKLNNELKFYEWFIEQNEEYKMYNSEFKKIYNIFDVFAKTTSLPRIAFANKVIDHKELKNIMKNEGFHYM